MSSKALVFTYYLVTFIHTNPSKLCWTGGLNIRQAVKFKTQHDTREFIQSPQVEDGYYKLRAFLITVIIQFTLTM
jgi:hypothetical protein